ncbi:hypothetical protein Terro_3174 [Terriglobus roseus DSM 18391]|uniref:Secreted protein n=1 Tax=Terriglobus roseus (strain DSM 18391 / NRRL B-41598 / KBS 63) TaxID=926566 RepID=I3ZJH8_TERRK|nr:hypothetical protein [Terriglobus roseus]AFL89396.1 hypothetical protein Terro_3174 [Terriglobus roseus DSM 18391]
MKHLRVAVGGLLLTCCVTVSKRANADGPGSTDPDLSPPAIVQGRPFSALKFARRVHLDGKGKQTLIQEMGHVLLARDADGTVTMIGAQPFDQQCDVPEYGTLPPCDYWRQFVFDPKVGSIWHWGEGPLGNTSQAIQISLSTAQLADAQRLTSALRPRKFNTDLEHGVFTQDLGEATIQGIHVTGFRTVTCSGASADGPKITFHEVWISLEMRLVVKVIDGDTEGNETVSGIEHLSLSPAASLFRPPPSRSTLNYTTNSEYAQDDLTALADWFVKA